MASHTVTFQPAGAKVVVDPADHPCGDIGGPGSILDIALTHGVDIEHVCGGMGVCGCCVVEIDTGAENLSEADPDELDVLESNDAPESARLACSAIVQGDVTVTVPKQ